ncbi:FAD-dependent oxidoreductase [Paludibaculum fermentans]|uniref:FAD-dependent oxidoreductase n=1 Tax=Paludibaculum fermentans TaxID=1473598 RepID=A0A7S7SJ54_PALFE|nr:FAD-dependent oxidoreductase [Paludibaculum fermentans]QOY86136.1 FAD-dependent oxidoreductase [Paludibaculum fermentans]
MSDLSTRRTSVIVLGGGPAGLGAAWQLARRGFAVTVVERGPAVGGNAGSLTVDGQRVDFGSHRLHPSCDPGILSDIRNFLGDDLLDRPRHGRIHLCGRWLHFPLKPADLVLHAPPAFAAGVLRDALWKPTPHGPENFASVLAAGLGPTICHDFYFPYAVKIWGMDPQRLDAEQARRRVSAGSLTKMVRKVLAPSKKGRFYYPRQGFGQISEAYAAAAEQAGAQILLNTSVTGIALQGNSRAAVEVRDAAGERTLEPGLVLSTIPIPQLARMLQPAAPGAILTAGGALRYRAMILIYVTLDTPQFTEYDAHYFPAAHIAITRLSEPKNYGLHGPAATTVLCAELPCDPADPVWQASDTDLQKLVLDALRQAGIPYEGRVLGTTARRLGQAYPVYETGFRRHFDPLDEWVSQLDGILTLGRQGLFAHDNTHHTLAMAYAAAECIDPAGRVDLDRWQQHRRAFEEFVVED